MAEAVTMDGGAAEIPVVELPLELLDESPTKRRRGSDPKKDAELLESVRKAGVLQPVLTRPGENGRFELVFGNRRARAARAAGLRTVPGTVRTLSDLEVLELQGIENSQRLDAHPLDEAELFRRLHADHGKSADEIAARIGKSRRHVYQRLKLLDLAPAAVQALEAGTLDASRALLLARLPNPKLQAEAWKAIGPTRWNEEGLSYRQAREEIERHFLLRLAEVPWALDDVDLLPAAGSCAACPNRSGNQTELFAEGEPTDLCLEPSCHAQKKEAHGRRALEEAKQGGARVLSDKEAKDVFETWGGVRRGAGYVELDGRCPEDPKHRTYRQLLKKTEGLERAVARMPKSSSRDRAGQVVELVASKGLTGALKAAGHDFRRLAPGHASGSAPGRDSSHESKRRVGKEEDRRIGAAVFAAARQFPPTPETLRLIARRVDLWGDEDLASMLGLESSGKPGEFAKACREWIDRADPVDLVAFLVWDAATSETGREREEVAKALGVDPKAIRAALKADLQRLAKAAPAKKPAKKKPAAKAGGWRDSAAPKKAPAKAKARNPRRAKPAPAPAEAHALLPAPAEAHALLELRVMDAARRLRRRHVAGALPRRGQVIGPPARERDQRIAYGTHCTWWGSIYEVGRLATPSGHPLPCCPHCKGLLFERSSEDDWWKGADAFEADGHPGYRAMMEWGRGRCFPSMEALQAAYQAAQGTSDGH